MEEPEVNKTESTTQHEEIIDKSPSTVEDKVKQPGPEVHVRKNKEEKQKKKDDKSVEQVLKALSTLGTSEEKLAAMCKKYTDIVDENRRLHLQMKQYDKKIIAMQREKEQLQNEQSKTIITRSRLESLCRELQKQNRQIKDESLQRIKEEEEKRRSVAAKFQVTLSEITALMQQNNDNNTKLRDENLAMQHRFKTLCEQYELREQQIEKMSKQMQLESQLAEAKLTKVKIEMIAEKELLENEKKQLLMELAAYQHKCQELERTEAALNNQITMYTEKYDKFQDALIKSNELYGGFRGEMEKMSKKITKLEKETSLWKKRWENSNKTLVEIASEKQLKINELTLTVKQLKQLQQLCRTLQADRKALLMQLKSEGITPKLPDHYNSDQEAGIENSLDSNLENKVEKESSPPDSCDKESSPPVISENGDEHIGDDERTCPLKDSTEEKSEKPEEPPPVPGEEGDVVEQVTPSNNEKGAEECANEKPEATTKTKKGKEGSKKRRK